jgi:hypothetical protein
MNTAKQLELFPVQKIMEKFFILGIPIYNGEFWTAKQRQASSIHEISYRACYKPQLPEFFINKFTQAKDVVYDPFSGRGTTVIQAGLMNRNVIANDINPLSTILTKSRFFIPAIEDIENRLRKIPFINKRANIDLSMFFNEKTEKEIISMQVYFANKECDYIDDWIRMVATNRLTGHSKGFFSVFTLPPNQAAKPERQIKINEQYNNKFEYKDTKKIILKKSKELLRDVNTFIQKQLKNIGEKGVFINENANSTKQIKSSSINLIVTSPPFLDIVDYASDNWLRNWFNKIEIPKLTIVKKIEEWEREMSKAFLEFHRILAKNGIVAFEVGEVRKGKVALDESVVKIGKEAGLKPITVYRNVQNFTKTANVWGINNNENGTNSNRIVVFEKEG